LPFQWAVTAGGTVEDNINDMGGFGSRRRSATTSEVVALES
jgi:hypothetical protein